MRAHLDAETHFDRDAPGVAPETEVTVTMRRDEWAVLAVAISDYIEGLQADIHDDLSADPERDFWTAETLVEAYTKIWNANVPDPTQDE